MGKNILKGNSAVLILSFLVLSIIFSVNPITALNAKVGNGKFVISNATVGQVIERSMKIYNNNSFDVRIELIPAGNLSNYIKIMDNNVTMSANSEKEFRFSVKVPLEGRNDGGINVKFTPVDMVANGKNGIIIPTTMVIFASKGKDIPIDWTGWLTGNKNSTKNNTGTDPGNPVNGMSLFEVLLMITAIVFILLLIILYIYSKRKNSGVKREKLNTKKRHS
jgi:hypothetical protein